ncbi:hypothetical protein ACOMHN_030334 [Nucella lapillus]
MSKLVQFYANILKSEATESDAVVRSHHLKQRMSRDFPQLTFLSPKQRNQSERITPDHVSCAEEVTGEKEKEPVKKKSKKRSVTLTEEPNSEYYLAQRVGPSLPMASNDKVMAMFAADELQKKHTNSIDLAMTMTKMPTVDESDGLLLIPSWTGFNVLLKAKEPVPYKSKVGYLPVISGSQTQLSTVNAVFLKSVALADELELDCIVLTFDLAFYAKAQQVRWNDLKYKERTVVRLGEFHTCMSFLSVIGKRFDDSGLADILLEAGTVAQGSLPGVMKGKQYNRSIRVVKLMTEALRRMLFLAFMDTQSEEERDTFTALCTRLRQAFPKPSFQEVTRTSSELQEFSSKLSSFIQERGNQFPTFSFWISYLDMADLLLNFVRATRDANWTLHIETAAKMVPWYFAHDHLNYARYLPVYIHEILAVPETHPSVAEPLANGEFVVQQQDQHPFRQTSMDQTIEQTINRDSKTRDSLKLHAQRANYQATLWRKCLQPTINAPSPTHHGWKLKDQGLIVQWSSLPSAPSTLSQLVKCSCQKNNCNSRRCSCVSQGVPCTGLCQCVNCANKDTVEEDTDSQQCDLEDCDFLEEEDVAEAEEELYQ